MVKLKHSLAQLGITVLFSIYRSLEVIGFLILGGIGYIVFVFSDKRF